MMSTSWSPRMSPRRVAHVLALAATATALAACGDDAGLVPQTVLRPASLVFQGDSADVTVPDTVLLGLPIPVLARSWGGGCTAAAPTGVTVTGTRIDVHPMVTEPHPAAQVACPAILRTIDHPTQVTYNRVGEVTIVVHGRSDPRRGPVTVMRRTVVVR